MSTYEGQPEGDVEQVGEQHSESPYTRSLQAMMEMWSGTTAAFLEKQRQSMTLVGAAMEGVAAEKAPNLFDPTLVPALMRSMMSLGKVGVEAWGSYMTDLAARATEMGRAVQSGDPEQVADLLEEYANAATIVSVKNPEAMEAIKEDMGFHVENSAEYEKVLETPRGIVWRVKPLAEGAETDETKKPVLLVSPFMLEDHIMALLPHEGVSFAHQFANDGMPTYVFRFHNPGESDAVRDMTGEDFTDDLAVATAALSERHGRPVTLETVCQGAYLSLLSLCSGKLDGHVDAFVQIVPPNAQTEDPILQKAMEEIPESQRDALPRIDPFPTGIATLSMQMRALQSPFADTLHALEAARKGPMNSFAAATNVWLSSYKDRPMPRALVQLTLDGANTPISEEGVLPQTLYGKELSVRHLEEQEIAWGIFAGGRDTVVSPRSAEGPLRFVSEEYRKGKVRFVENPKAGHVTYLTTATTEKGRAQDPDGPLGFTRMVAARGE